MVTQEQLKPRMGGVERHITYVDGNQDEVVDEKEAAYGIITELDENKTVIYREVIILNNFDPLKFREDRFKQLDEMVKRGIDL